MIYRHQTWDALLDNNDNIPGHARKEMIADDNNDNVAPIPRTGNDFMRLLLFDNLV